MKIFYDGSPQESEHYGRLATVRHTQRIKNLIKNTGGSVIIGGDVDVENRYVSPTIVNNVTWDDALMKEEIFGPVLPIITYEADVFDESVLMRIKEGEKPLALYLFTQDISIKEQVINEVSFGGGVINGSIIHLINSYLPFGGVGFSGIGKYHGKYSFDEFTHKKSIVEKGKLTQLNILHPPYNSKKYKLLKKLMK